MEYDSAMSNIAFCGDSFCADIRQTEHRGPGRGKDWSLSYKDAWPSLVEEKFNFETEVWGLSGSPLYHSYDFLLRVLEKTDKMEVVIFCITEPGRFVNYYRIPYLRQPFLVPNEIIPNEIIHPLSVYKMIKKVYNKNTEPTANEMLNWSDNEKQMLLETVINYKRYFDDNDYNCFVQKGILMQMDEHMLHIKQKCIWFPCFTGSMQGFVPKSGPIANQSLSKISSAEYDTYEEYHDTIMGGDTHRLNHMSMENNINMSNLIIDIINNDDFSPGTIKMENYFNGI